SLATALGIAQRTKRSLHFVFQIARGALERLLIIDASHAGLTGRLGTTPLFQEIAHFAVCSVIRFVLLLADSGDAGDRLLGGATSCDRWFCASVVGGAIVVRLLRGGGCRSAARREFESTRFTNPRQPIFENGWALRRRSHIRLVEPVLGANH